MIDSLKGPCPFADSRGIIVSKLNQLPKVVITFADELEVSLDLCRDLIVFFGQSRHLPKTVDGATHDYEKKNTTEMPGRQSRTYFGRKTVKRGAGNHTSQEGRGGIMGTRQDKKMQAEH